MLDPERPRYAREIGLMLPRLRMTIVRSRTADTVSIDDLLPTLGRTLLALSVWVETILALGGEVSFSLIDQAFRSGKTLCELLARLDRVPQYVPGDDTYQLTLYRTQEVELQRLLTFVHDENPARRLSLGAIFGELRIDDAATRAQLLQSFTPEALARFVFEPPR